MSTFETMFESQLSKSIKISKDSEKERDRERKDDDRKKQKADDEARKAKKDTPLKPKTPKANVPGEGELMAQEIGAQAELDTADAGAAEPDKKPTPPKDTSDECEEGDDECEKKKKEKESDKKDKPSKNESFYKTFEKVLY